MEDSPDARVQIKYQCFFVARNPEIFRTLKVLGSMDIFPLVIYPLPMMGRYEPSEILYEKNLPVHCRKEEIRQCFEPAKVLARGRGYPEHEPCTRSSRCGWRSYNCRWLEPGRRTCLCPKNEQETS